MRLTTIAFREKQKWCRGSCLRSQRISFTNSQGRRARYRLLFRDKVKGQSSRLTPGGDRESVVVRCLRGFIGNWGFFENMKKLRGVDLLSRLWILKINNIRNFLPWFLSGTPAPWSGSISKGCRPSPQGGLRYCLLAKESCLLNFLGVKMQSYVQDGILPAFYYAFKAGSAC